MNRPDPAGALRVVSFDIGRPGGLSAYSCLPPGMFRNGVRGLPHVSLRRLLHIARRLRKLSLPSLPHLQNSNERFFLFF